MGSYINSTKPDPYDQLIDISQKAINKSFEYMWNNAQLDDNKKNPLKHFFYSVFGSWTQIDTDVGIPSVQLQVTTTDPQLYFIFRMTKGSLQISPDGDPDNPDAIKWDIKDWSFAFSVTIGESYAPCLMLLESSRPRTKRTRISTQGDYQG